jgi:preprotein translocase subunit SecE
METFNGVNKIQEFFKEVLVEMKRVSWLSRKDVVRYTFIVLGITIVVALFLGGLDFIFTEVIKIFILR